MAFEALVEQGVGEGRPEEALAQAVRGRSRTLMDQFQLAGADPREELPGEGGEELRRREAAARRRVSAIQARARMIPLQDAEGKEAQALLGELEEAPGEHAAARRAGLHASPRCRRL